MINKEERLNLKNKFDGSIVFQGSEFDDKTGRTKHMDNCKDMINSEIISNQTGLIDTKYTFHRNCPLCEYICESQILFIKQGFKHVILLDKYVKEDSWSEVLLNEINLNMDKKKFEFGLMLIEELIKDHDIKFNKKLLDIGSGSGLFLKVAQDQNWNVKGIEFNEKTRDFSEEILNVEVINELIENIRKDDLYGTISLWNVLEHIISTKNFLQQIHMRLESDGLLFISVPNADCLSTIFRKEKSNTFLGSSHVNFFNIDYLNKMVEVEGFELLHSETYVTELNNIKEYVNMFYDNDRLKNIINLFTPKFIDDNYLGSKLIAIYKKIDKKV